MRKEVVFIYGSNQVSVSPDLLIPRIGERIDIYNLIPTDEEREEYDKFKENGELYVLDIYHDLSEDEQYIEITLSNNFDYKNDFYINLSEN
jgi:hypothetical protein